MRLKSEIFVVDTNFLHHGVIPPSMLLKYTFGNAGIGHKCYRIRLVSIWYGSGCMLDASAWPLILSNMRTGRS